MTPLLHPGQSSFFPLETSVAHAPSLLTQGHFGKCWEAEHGGWPFKDTPCNPEWGMKGNSLERRVKIENFCAYLIFILKINESWLCSVYGSLLTLSSGHLPHVTVNLKARAPQHRRAGGDNDPHSFVLWWVSKALLFLCDHRSGFQDYIAEFHWKDPHGIDKSTLIMQAQWTTNQKGTPWTSVPRVICQLYNDMVEKRPFIFYKRLIQRIQNYQEKTQNRHSDPFSGTKNLNLSV